MAVCYIFHSPHQEIRESSAEQQGDKGKEISQPNSQMLAQILCLKVGLTWIKIL